MSAHLHLDFVAAPRRPPLTWLCLLLGAALLAMAADRYAEAEEQVLQAESQLARLQRQNKNLLLAQGRSDKGGSQAQSQQREQKLLDQAARADWQPVLSAVENAVDAKVAILDLNQEGAARRLRISAEARTIEDALAMAERLRSSGKFADVMLSSHENRKSTGIDVLGFTLLANW